jgi:hypothetical protein
MKPAQIVLLVAAGALGGALITTQVRHKSQQPKQIAVVEAQQPAATPAPVAQPAPAAPSPVEPEAAKPEPMPEAVQAASKPSPMPARRETARQRPTTRTAPPPAHPRPVETARVEEPMPRPTTVHAPVQAPAAPPVVAPAPQPASPPPARPEPEHATPPPPPAEPAPNRVTLNPGMLLPVRLIDGLSSERNLAGDTFTGTLDKELVVDGFVIAERGARVDGRVASVDRAGKVKGVAAMAIELTRIHTSDGQTVNILTDTFERRAEASRQTDAAKVGGGAAIGAIIGAIAGGGKGAAIGAGVGGGAGAGDVLLTRGKPITFPSEMRLSFRLRAPVTITERR